MVSYADSVTNKNTTEPQSGTEQKKGAGKTLKKSWGRSLSNFFTGKSVKASAKLKEEPTLSVVPVNQQEHNVEATPEPPRQQKRHEVPPEQTEKIDRGGKISDVDDKGACGSKRPNNCVGSADGAHKYVEDSGRQEFDPSPQILQNETGEDRIAGKECTPRAAARSYSNPHQRNTNKSHVLSFGQDDSSAEAELPVTFNEDASGNKSHSGCLPLGETSCGKRPQEVQKGRIIYSKAGGSEDDTITFEVSLNDSLMKEVLNSIQEGQIPVSLVTYGRRGRSTKDNLEKCASSMGPDDTSDQFSVDIELCDPVGKEVNVGDEHTDGNNVEGIKHYSSFPEVVELQVRRQIAENDAHGKDDCQLRNGSLLEGASHSKEFTGLILSPITASSNSALTSYSSHGIEIVEEEFDDAHGRYKGGPQSQNCSASVRGQSSSNIGQSNEDKDGDYHQITTPSENVGMPYGTGIEHYPRDKNSTQSVNQHTGRGVWETQGHDSKGPKSRKQYSSSNSSMEYQKSKRYPSSNSSVECRRSQVRSKGRNTDRLRDRAVIRAHVKREQFKKLRSSEAEAIDSTFCPFKRHRQRQKSSSQRTESLSASSERYPEEGILRDTPTMIDDGRNSRKPRNGGEKLHVRRGHDDMSHSLNYRSGGKDEEIVGTTSGDQTQSYKNRYDENSTFLMSGPKRAKRPGWNTDQRANECNPAGLDDQGMAAGVRRYQSSCSTILSFRKSKASVGDCGESFLDHVYMSELRGSSVIEDCVAGYEQVWDDNYSRISLHGKPVNSPRVKTCWSNLIDDWAYSARGLEHNIHAGDCGNGSVFLEPVDPDEYADEYGSQNPEENITEGALRTDQGPENKWLQRIGNLSLAQESDEYNIQDSNGFTQRQGDGCLVQEPHCSYSSLESNKPPVFSKSGTSDSRQDQSGEMPSDQQIHRPPKGSVEEHTKTFQTTLNEAPDWNECLTEVGLEGENITRRENLAVDTVPKDQGLQVRTPCTPQHTANGKCMAQAFQSLLQSFPRGGCCHINSGLGTEGSLPSASKDGKLGKVSSSAERDTCDMNEEFPGSSFTSREAARNVITENQATEDDHTLGSSSIYTAHSLELGATCTPLGPRRKEKCILAGAIKSGTKEIRQPGVREEPCRHEFIRRECRNEFMYSCDLPRGRKDQPSCDPEEHASSSQHVPQVFLQDMPSTDFEDLKQREASWKQCQKRYDAMVKKIQKMSEQAHSGLDLNPVVPADTIKLDDQIQNTLTDSNIAGNSSIPADNQTQKLASCSCERSQQERKLPRGKLKPTGRSLGHHVGRDYIFGGTTVKSIVKRNVSDDSSSDEDIYDRASRKFRDELFKRIPRKDAKSSSISSQVLTVSCGDCLHQVKRKKVHEVQRHLRNLTSSDPFRFSAVYKELLRVEQELKEIARVFASQAHMENSNSLDAPDDPCDSQEAWEKLKSKGSEGKKRPIDSQDGGSELVGKSSPDLEREFLVSVYENPMWSKWLRPKTNSCGGPLSVHMAARLSNADVPVDYENGYKVQYVPVDKRGITGMRDKHRGSEKRCRLLRLDETPEFLKNSRLPAEDSSSSSSSANPRGSPNMQLEALSGCQESDSSTSDSGSKLLHQRHQRGMSKDARRRKTHKYETDSDSTNNSYWSDNDGPNLELFVGEAEEQLERLKLAKVQLGRLCPDSRARVNTLYRKPLSKTSDTIGSDRWITERYERATEFREGRRAKHVIRQKNRRSTVATTLPTKKLTAREIKEFHLLERRVQRELGASGRKREAANCQDQDQERTSEHFNESPDNARGDEILHRCQHCHTCHRNLSQVALTEPAGNDKKCGMTRSVSSPIEHLNDTMSSVVRLKFGGPRELPLTNAGRTAAEDFQRVHHMIQRKVELLETEILNFTKGNKKFNALLKEQDEHADRLKRDKEAWEHQKASDMEIFQKLKDSQMSKLQKERTKLEQQARTTVSKVPKKEERRALDELKARLAQAQEAHSKKEEQWRLTNNRLRKANKGLLEQIHELRNQIRRLEDEIFSQLDVREDQT